MSAGHAGGGGGGGGGGAQDAAAGPPPAQKPRALVLGGQGTLGQALVTFLPEAAAGGGWQVTAPARTDCDIADAAQVDKVLDQVMPDVVFNAAGLTNVDRAEDDPVGAWRANAVAPEILARATAARGMKLVHYSTDFVFDGALDRPYDERDRPAPLSVYGRSKLAGEQAAAAASPLVFVVRVACLYGRGGRNFPSRVLGRLRAGEIVRADRERAAAPTWVRDVARVSGALAATGRFGLYHCTAAGETTWLGFARLVARELGLAEDRVEPSASATLPMMHAPRPRKVIFDNRAVRLAGLEPIGDWQARARAFVCAETGRG
jgi:dTDP-4-dehydrorhamnose reductase